MANKQGKPSQVKNFLEVIRKLKSFFLNDPEMIDLINKSCEALVHYFNIVVKMMLIMSTTSPSNFLSREDYIDKVKNLDLSRKLSHDSAISSLNILNRIAESVGMEKISGDLDTSDRNAVGDFIGIFVMQIYEGRNIQDFSKEIPTTTYKEDIFKDI